MQPDSHRRGGTIVGEVFAQNPETPLEYVNIVLFSVADSAQITGTITDTAGRFKLEGISSGDYWLTLRFIGYADESFNSIKLNRQKPVADLGRLYLKSSAVEMEGVDVTGAAPALTYEIDKKVVNVSKHYTATSGSAVDVLENVPSVNVDIDGNVSLRGSTNFTVLIDGRSSILDPNDALEQIPSTAIENIEIITNPSAKYDPEGTAGIFNIIMKKDSKNGSSGMIAVNAAQNDSYGGDVQMTNHTGSMGWTLALSYGERNHPGTTEQESYTILNDTTTYVNSDGDRNRGHTRYGVRGALDWDLTGRDWFSVGFRLGGRSMERSSDLNYTQWQVPETSLEKYSSNNVSEHSGMFYGLFLDYRHKFNQDGHELSSNLMVGRRDMDEESTDKLLDIDGNKISGNLTTQEGPGDRMNLKIEYVLPLSGERRFEAGLQSNLRESEDDNTWVDYNPETGTYDYDNEYGYNIQYKRNVHSAYMIFADELDAWGYQVGFRGEYTDRLIEPDKEFESFRLDRWDFFPTLHTSFSFSETKQLMASYTRRINRPRGWYLEPFETWIDAFNVRVGNPDLKPEYIHSFEIGFQSMVGKQSISVEGYYRSTENKIERIRSVIDDGIYLNTSDNVGKDHSTGVEFMINTRPIDLWSISLQGNVFDYQIETDYAKDDQQSTNWRLRMNNMFTLSPGTRLQFNTTYNSKSVTAQGEREGFCTADLGLRYEMVPNKFTWTFQIRDIFASGLHNFESSGPDFYSMTEFTRDAPVYSLNLTYTFNNYKQEREQGQGEDEFLEDDF